MFYLHLPLYDSHFFCVLVNFDFNKPTFMNLVINLKACIWFHVLCCVWTGGEHKLIHHIWVSNIWKGSFSGISVISINTVLINTTNNFKIFFIPFPSWWIQLFHIIRCISTSGTLTHFVNFPYVLWFVYDVRWRNHRGIHGKPLSTYSLWGKCATWNLIATGNNELLKT